MKDRKIITIGVKNFNMQIDIQKEVEKLVSRSKRINERAGLGSSEMGLDTLKKIEMQKQANLIM